MIYPNTLANLTQIIIIYYYYFLKCWNFQKLVLPNQKNIVKDNSEYFKNISFVEYFKNILTTMIFHPRYTTLTHQTLNVPIANLIMYKTLKLIHTLVT
jgi:hypothetical protein